MMMQHSKPTLLLALTAVASACSSTHTPVPRPAVGCYGATRTILMSEIVVVFQDTLETGLCMQVTFAHASPDAPRYFDGLTNSGPLYYFGYAERYAGPCGAVPYDLLLFRREIDDSARSFVDIEGAGPGQGSTESTAGPNELGRPAEFTVSMALELTFLPSADGSIEGGIERADAENVRVTQDCAEVYPVP